MHTLMVILGGLVLLGVFALLAPAIGMSVGRAALWFIPVWLIGSAINMWIGVSRAGYTVAQEFPIFLVVFGVPALLAWLIRWRHTG